MPSEAGEEQEMLDLEVLTGRRRPASQRWPWTERPPSQKGICSVFFFFFCREFSTEQVILCFLLLSTSLRLPLSTYVYLFVSKA